MGQASSLWEAWGSQRGGTRYGSTRSSSGEPAVQLREPAAELCEQPMPGDSLFQTNTKNSYFCLK